MKQFFPMLMTCLLLTCACTSQSGPDEHVYWVNSLKVPCEGVAPAHCLQVYKGETLDPSEWKFFHGPIDGFEFEAGYVYKLLVKERELDQADVPADASSIEYILVRILQKEQDKRLVLNDIWVLEKLKGKTINRGIDNDQLKMPQLEFHVGEMRYTGTDGCNNIFGGILELNEKTLRFGIGAGTRMMCQHMEVPDEFNRTIPQVNSYEVKDLKLHLLDADGIELMQFQKID